MFDFAKTWLSEKLNRMARSLISRESISLTEYQHWFDTNPYITHDGHLESFRLIRKLSEAGSTNDVIHAERWLQHGRTGEILGEIHEMVLKICIPYAPKGPSRHHQITQIVSAFQDEIRINNLVASTNIEGVVRPLGGGQAGRIIYFKMEFIPGQSLDHTFTTEISNHEFYTRLAKLAYMANTISQLHHYQVIHSDLKPKNLMLCQDPKHPNFGKILLCDFGYSNSRLRDTISKYGGKLSPIYTAPEQALVTQSLLTRMVDYFSFGVVAHEYLTGEPLFPLSSQIFIEDGHRITHRYLEHLRVGRANRIADPEIANMIDVLTLVDSRQREAECPNLFDLAHQWRLIAEKHEISDVNTEFLRNQLLEYETGH
jgi:serine/threonine protein kinase